MSSKDSDGKGLYVTILVTDKELKKNRDPEKLRNLIDAKFEMARLALETMIAEGAYRA